jgi:hypothetical protein
LRTPITEYDMRRRSEGEWDAILTELPESGLSQAEYARQRGVALASLQYQLKRRRDATAEAAGFVEVRAGARAVVAREVGAFEVRVGPHICVRCAELPDAAWLAALTRAMSSR